MRKILKLKKTRENVNVVIFFISEMLIQIRRALCGSGPPKKLHPSNKSQQKKFDFFQFGGLHWIVLAGVVTYELINNYKY